MNTRKVKQALILSVMAYAFSAAPSSGQPETPPITEGRKPLEVGEFILNEIIYFTEGVDLKDPSIADDGCNRIGNAARLLEAYSVLKDRYQELSDPQELKDAIQRAVSACSVVTIFPGMDPGSPGRYHFEGRYVPGLDLHGNEGPALKYSPGADDPAGEVRMAHITYELGPLLEKALQISEVRSQILARFAGEESAAAFGEKRDE